uniref:CSON013395 protein n=1 Tax=Culicoides sonorensis TaxID=179676 RepID=A0A336KSH1_CULSO
MDIYSSTANELFRRCQPENVDFLMKIAKSQNMPELEKVCKKIFNLQTYAVLESWLLFDDSDYDFEDEIVKEFFSVNHLHIVSEFDLYVILETLVEAKCLKGWVKSLKEIRFQAMDTREVLDCKLLRDSQKCAIIANIDALIHREDPKIPMPEGFSTTFRNRNPTNERGRFMLWIMILLKCPNYDKNLDRFNDIFCLTQCQRCRLKFSTQKARTTCPKHLYEKADEIYGKIYPHF